MGWGIEKLYNYGNGSDKLLGINCPAEQWQYRNGTVGTFTGGKSATRAFLDFYKQEEEEVGRTRIQRRNNLVLYYYSLLLCGGGE